MTRPRRLYKDNKDRYFYIIKGKIKYVKVPKDLTEKDIVKINLKTLENLINRRRVVKRKKKRRNYRFEKPIVSGAPSIGVTQSTTDGPSKLVVEGRKITQIEDIIKNTKQKKAEQLAENVETFFDALSKKKDSLKLGTELVISDDIKKDSLKLGSELVIKTEKVADKNPPKEPEKTEEFNNLSTRLKQIGKKIIKYAKSLPAWAKVYEKGYTFESDTYTDFANKAIRLFDVNEDEKKELLISLKENKELENNWADGFEKFLDSQESTVIRSTSTDESTPPSPPSVPKPKPVGEQIKNIKKEIRKPKDTSSLMPSLKVKPKTTEQKLAETPSFSGSTTGTVEPGAPLASSPLSTSPMDESIAEQVRREIAIQEKSRSLMGLGEDGDDALYNDEIAKIIKRRVGRVIPVIPSDKVKYLKDYVERGDKIFAAIINTADSTSNGTGENGNSLGHWTAVFVDNRDDYPSIEYFDPLVSIPEKELVVELKKIAKKMNPERMFLYKENRLQRQAKQASTCGFHCLQYVDDRINGESWCQATGYDDFINRMGKVDDSVDGEKDVRKYIKKYKVYI